MWHSIWSLDLSLYEKVLRAVAVYALLVICFRVFGKRELAQSTTLDFAVLLLVANAVQNGIIGNDISVTGAVVSAFVLFGLNTGLSRLAIRSPAVARVLEGTPTKLMSNGRPDRTTLRREHISLPELRAIARSQGFADLAVVHTAILETNGTVTMFREDEVAD